MLTKNDVPSAEHVENSGPGWQKRDLFFTEKILIPSPHGDRPRARPPASSVTHTSASLYNSPVGPLPWQGSF